MIGNYNYLKMEQIYLLVPYLFVAVFPIAGLKRLQIFPRLDIYHLFHMVLALWAGNKPAVQFECKVPDLLAIPPEDYHLPALRLQEANLCRPEVRVADLADPE